MGIDKRLCTVRRTGGVQSHDAHDALIVDHGARRLEKAVHGFVALMGFDDLGDGANHHLSG